MVAALRTAVPSIGTEATALLRDPQPPPVETVLTSLVNDVSAVDADVVLVLDDYHVIGNVEIHAGRGLPGRPPAAAAPPGHRQPGRPAPAAGRGSAPAASWSRCAPATCGSPPGRPRRTSTTPWGCPSARTTSACSAGAPRAGSRPCSWPPCRSRTATDASDFIAGFAGDDRYVVDYLAEEVLQRQQPDVQSFLLQTSVLDRMTGPLCDAVTGTRRGRAMLEKLERDNLFVVPLDDNRRWYRYHHLFADVLQDPAARRAARRRRGAAPASQRVVRAERRPRCSDPACDVRRRRRHGGGPGRARDAGHAA